MLLPCGSCMVYRQYSRSFAMYTVIAAWSTDPIKANFAMLNEIAVWSTDNSQAGFPMLTAIAAWYTDNI